MAAISRSRGNDGWLVGECSECGKGMRRFPASAEVMTCRVCAAQRRERWRSEGRPCSACGRITGRWTRAKCLRCDQVENSCCDVHGCERPSLARGLCSSHYAWQWRVAAGAANGRGTWIEPKRRLSIYERDGWQCGICGDLIDRSAGVNADLAPSLDHIVPRLLGGGHESENLRTAHRACNARRGAIVEEVPSGA